MIRYQIVTLKVGQEAQDPHLPLSKFNVKVQFNAADGYTVTCEDGVLSIAGRMHVVDMPFSSVLSAVRAVDVSAPTVELDVLKASIGASPAKKKGK